MTPTPIHLIFVCHGNICRSPMAEFVMKDLAHKAGASEQFIISSLAATTEEVGHDMYPPARRLLTQKGIPFSPRQARQLTMADYEKADYIVCMDQENVEDLDFLTHGDPEKKVSLLLDWAKEHREVADPWYTGDFATTYQDVLKGCQALLQRLLKK